MNRKEQLIDHMNKLHTTEMGIGRIRNGPPKNTCHS